MRVNRFILIVLSEAGYISVFAFHTSSVEAVYNTCGCILNHVRVQHAPDASLLLVSDWHTPSLTSPTLSISLKSWECISSLHDVGTSRSSDKSAVITGSPSLSSSVSISCSSSVLATGPHSQLSLSFTGSSIINIESKAPNDCDYLLWMDRSLQTCSAAKHRVLCKYDSSCSEVYCTCVCALPDAGTTVLCSS